MCKRRFLISAVFCVFCFRYLSHQISFEPTETHRIYTTDKTCLLPNLNTSYEHSVTKFDNISCERIIKGDKAYMKSLSSLYLGRRISSEAMLQERCDSILFDDVPVTEEELDFPLAFALKVHKDPLQVQQLLRTIYRPHNVYCIHVDLKSDRHVVKSLQDLANCFPNVFVLQKVNVVYGSIGLTLSDIVCMETLVESEISWKYYLNLAGQEFPIKTNLEIVRILQLLKGRNDIESYPFPKSLRFRFVTSWIIQNDNNIVNTKISKSPFNHKIPFYKGSLYGMFTRSFVNFVLRSTISKELISWATDTYAPEELIWATLNSLHGTPGGYNVTVSQGDRQFLSRAIIWRGGRINCRGKFVRSVCVFNFEDLPWLTSSPEIVANKFHSDFDQLVVDCLEEWLHNKTVIGNPVDIDWSYYRNLPHVRLANVDVQNS